MHMSKNIVCQSEGVATKSLWLIQKARFHDCRYITPIFRASLFKRIYHIYPKKAHFQQIGQNSTNQTLNINFCNAVTDISFLNELK